MSTVDSNSVLLGILEKLITIRAHLGSRYCTILILKNLIDTDIINSVLIVVLKLKLNNIQIIYYI